MNLIETGKLIEKTIQKRRPAKVLIPIMPDVDNETLFKLAHWISHEMPVLFVGVVPVPEGESLSTGTGKARALRQLINKNVDRVVLRAKARIRVSYNPWDEIRVVLAKEQSVNLLVLNWPQQLEILSLTPAEILSHPPCDVAIIRGPLPDRLEHILVPMRGGPHAERALSLSLKLASRHRAQITALRLISKDPELVRDATFAGMSMVLSEMPQVEQSTMHTDNEIDAILEASQRTDLIVLGTGSHPYDITTSFGEITDTVLNKTTAGVIAIKTKRVVMPEEGSRFGAKAISVLVDRWFAENTFHADEFADVSFLLALKQERGVKISLALPALNEEKTVGDIIRVAQRTFMEKVPLLDEIVLMDSNSTDRTREIAESLGVPVYIHQKVLPQHGARDGKGEALWKSLYVTTGDIVVWVDTDVSNFHPRFVYGLIGPLLQRLNIKFIKGFYRRPLKTGKVLRAGRGGRVTELTARPLLNLFYPELSGVIQPLAGEYGGQRDVLEKLTFTSGYGVETCLLIDVLEKYGLSAIGQVDMVERIHRNQSLPKLSKMAFAIIQALFSKLELRYEYEILHDVNRTMKTVLYEGGEYRLQVEEIAELERPPMITIPEYRQARGLPALDNEMMPV